MPRGPIWENEVRDASLREVKKMNAFGEPTQFGKKFLGRTQWIVLRQQDIHITTSTNLLRTDGHAFTVEEAEVVDV